ncbi:squamous cell carcinoma antigen recognized by T-cells 3-like isoform X2 [Dendronephthya gigantea]|uniref:squamous cell carcinoma antigen recognized by T-cells 3-like isoform X2 n=1 Tax=Dendronephthya gigantea TaxID=151771 RepID=UPI001069E6B2|nr:squamous cell carcinoma antigen recognized by T-cells 3-like isoform X2 [Dendronephthya gigantea]
MADDEMDCSTTAEGKSSRSDANLPEFEQEDEMEDNSDDSDDSSDDEKAEGEEITALRQFLENSPFHYESHLKLIKALRDIGDLDRTRQARETMSKIFPLTAELWLEWIQDELPLACITEQKKYIRELFEKAVKDYQSVKIWTEYCQYVLDNMEGEDGLEDARAVFERAITSVGLHLTEGVSIWDGYREFEMALYDSYQTMAAGSDLPQVQQKLERQKEKVKSIFRREISVPLIGMQAVFREYEQWLGDEEVLEYVTRGFNKAEAKLETCLPYEEALASATSPKLDEYRSYIAFEMKGGDLARVQCLYERAIVDNCLNYEFWIEYTSYMDTKLNIADVVLPVHERATRNCPWVVGLWCNYLRALERTGQNPEKVQETLERGLSSLSSTAQDSASLWCCFLEYLRRRVGDWEIECQEKDDLKKAYKDGLEYLERNFGRDADSQALILRHKAYVEATKLKNISEAKRIWDSVMPHHNREAEYWLEYIRLLRQVNDNVGCRKVFIRAIQTSNDKPELLCELFQKFEKDEGSLEDLDSAMNKCSTRLKRVWEQKTREYEKAEVARLAEQEANTKKEQAKAEKRAQKKAEMKSKVGKTKRKHEKDDEAGKDREVSEPETKRPFVSKGEEFTKPNEKDLKEAPVEKVHDRSKDPQTVFVSNLTFTVDEEQLKSTFSPLGEINEIRLVRNLQGKSKGYAYVEFKNQSSISAALAIDRQELCGRPMFVSPCVDKTQNPTTFRFPTSLDKCTVFVTNLPFELKSSEIEDVFKVHGKVKQVRLVTNRSGKSKGYAYVEYEDEAGAAAAVLKQDQSTLNNRVINVALSNPPKKQRQEHESRVFRPEGRPGRARTQVQFVPRALKKAPHVDTSQPSPNEEENPKPALSNDDFRKMFK